MARARVKKIDNVFWGVASGVISALTTGSSAALNFIAVGTQPATLLRMRGEVLVYADGVQATGGLSRVTMGVIKVPEGSSTTVRYDPETDPNAPWLWYDVAHVGYEEMVDNVVDVPVVSGRRILVDNKAMRRIRPDEEFQIVFTNTTIIGGLSVNCAYLMRVLQGF